MQLGYPTDEVPEPIDLIAVSNAVYTERGIELASEYLKSRNLDAGKLAVPWTVTHESTPYGALPHPLVRNPERYRDALFIPITGFPPDGAAVPPLAGFDVRALRDSPSRPRYQKIKGDLPLVYGLHNLRRRPPYVVVTEGAIDAETFHQLGFPAVSALSASKTVRWAGFLSALTPNVVIAYDMDEQGRKQAEALQEHFRAAGFRVPHVMSYKGTDPSDCASSFGLDYLRSQTVEAVNYITQSRNLKT